MSIDIGSDFDDIEKAEGSNKLPPITAGNYKLKVEALKFIKSRAKGNFAIGEFTVLEALGDGAASQGAKVSHMIKMSLDSAKANVKNLVAAVMGEPEKNVTTAIAKEAFSDEQPCKGQVIAASAFNVKTKANTDFTVVKYSPGTSSATAIPTAAVATFTAPPKTGKTSKA